MNTQLATTRSTAVAVPTEVSPWREAANEEGGASFGTLLKFVKGEWFVGEERTELPLTTMLVANMNEYWRGWIKWVDQQPVAHAIGRVVDRHRVHLREELDEPEKAGQDDDPWQRVSYLVMRYADSDEVVTFTTTSDGGRKAVAKLADRYDRMRHKHPAQMPVVTLACDSYQHDEYGKVLKPKFVVVGWDFWDEEAKKDPAGTLQQQHADEMNDQIPF
jgi:hypothetical protein